MQVTAGATLALMLFAGLAPAVDTAARVQSLLVSGNIAQARAELQAALSGQPSDPALLNLLGVLEAQQGNTATAEQSFLRALAGAPRSTAIYENLGRLYQQGLATDPAALGKAISVYRKLLELEPGSTNARYQLAFLLGHDGKCAESLTHLQRLGAAVQRPQALALAAACGAATHQPDAEGRIAELRQHPQLTEQDVLGVLPILTRAKKDEVSLLLLSALVQRRLATAATLTPLAALQESSGQYAAARNSLEHLVQTSGATPALLTALARNAYQDKDYQGTLSYLAHARDLQPESASIHFFFGMTAVALDLPLEAKKSLAEAVRLDPENPYHQYAYGAVLAQDREAGLAIPYLQKYCTLKPGDVRGRFALAVARYLSGQYDEARAELTKLTAHRETAAGAKFFLGRIAKHEGRLDDAVQDLQAALRLAPNQLGARAELGQVYTRLQQYTLAEAELTRALTQDPEHYYANLYLLALYQRTKDPRAQKQAERMEVVKAKRSEKEQALWRTIEVRPY